LGSVYPLLVLLQEFVQFHHQFVECLGGLLDSDSLAEIPESLSFLGGHCSAS
jgi:hypothetical protein